MKTNDIKKGMVVELRNGWFGIMADNMKGNTRMVDVVGLYREIGSVYSHDIIKAWDNKEYGLYNLRNSCKFERRLNTLYIYEFGNCRCQLDCTNDNNIEHTKKQLELKQMVASY
jgi:hypothetical protein|tara:strand:+ start:317 stop:658 length:342 start_codon:yes stop_codon:yes gene_type:complete